MSEIRRYRAPKDLRYYTRIRGYAHESKFLTVQPDGLIIVRQGYTSDGCSPTIRPPRWFRRTFQFGWVLGPPNGPPDSLWPHLPISYRAFMLHDALIEFARDVMPMLIIHKLFCWEINKTNWQWRGLACFMVCKFGPKR